MKTRVRHRASHALLLRSRELRAIWQLLASTYTSVTATATCSEGSVFETAELEDILSFDNPSYRHIEQIELAARSDYEERATLQFSDRGTIVDLAIYSENDAKALHTATELMLRVAEAKPGYSFMTRIKASNFILGAMWAYTIAETLWRVFVRGLSTRMSNLSFDAVTVTLVVAAILYFVLLRPLDRLQNWLFPRLFFVIGRQEDELRRRERWRSIIFSSFAVSVLASLVAAFLLKVLSH